MEKESHEDVLREVGPAGIAALAEAWASMSRGHLEDFQRERDAWQATGTVDYEAPSYTGRWLGYTADAEEVIKRMRARGFTVVSTEEKAKLERTKAWADRVFNNRLGFTFEPTHERVTIYFDGHRSFEICQQQADLVRQMLSVGAGDYELVPWFDEDDPPHTGRVQQTIKEMFGEIHQDMMADPSRSLTPPAKD